MSNNTQVEREKRAREVIADLADADGFPKYAEWIRAGGPLDGKFGSWARTNDWGMPTSTIRAMLAFNTEEVERLRVALEQIVAADQRRTCEPPHNADGSNRLFDGPAAKIARTALGDTDHG